MFWVLLENYLELKFNTIMKKLPYQNNYIHQRLKTFSCWWYFNGIHLKPLFWSIDRHNKGAGYLYDYHIKWNFRIGQSNYYASNFVWAVIRGIVNHTIRYIFWTKLRWFYWEIKAQPRSLYDKKTRKKIW